MRWFLVILVMLCMGCEEPGYVIHSPPDCYTEVVKVHVDRTFSVEEMGWIDTAVAEWNISLNGYMRLEVVSRAFDMGESEMKEDGVFLLRVRSDNPIVPTHNDGGRTLGWTNVGGKWIWIVEDRIFRDKMVGVVMHELGHVLGSDHLGEKSLMYKYDAGRSKCVDEETARKIAEVHKWKIDHMRWCK